MRKDSWKSSQLIETVLTRGTVPTLSPLRVNKLVTVMRVAMLCEQVGDHDESCHDESEQVGDHDQSCHGVKRSDHDERWHDEKPENDMFAIKKSPQ